MNNKKEFIVVKIMNVKKETFDIRVGATNKVWINVLTSELVDILSQMNFSLTEITKSSKVYPQRVISAEKFFDKILVLAKLHRDPRVASERLSKANKKNQIIGTLVELEKYDLVKKFYKLSYDDISKQISEMNKTTKVYKALEKF